ncbi:SDR family NAD(P)-dependent oxidoreductase [Phycicoccus flavus]|uniref:SDR family NAD(P)-dependent oxidoreductase n=1 Tax=Phycicoccus flavus TaxID=2502783 RepID=UPI000FEB6EA3|nr:SDR family NAD(P)-dependent oxidoreductase [Phycicoccus flavus]NHA67678.1 SDR family NAD(P)-dependent oxidoreductase [Phycicoccus flavus]
MTPTTVARPRPTPSPPSAEHPVAIVAGASRGLGLEISRVLVARGWRVHGLARDGAELDRAVAAVGGPDGAYVPHVADVRDPDRVAAVVDAVLGEDGRVDAAFHVAGVIEVGGIEGVTLGHVHEAVDTMLYGPLHLALAVLPAMRERGVGRIGVVASVGGLVAVPRLLPYCVAKFGAVGLAEGLAAELAGTGVTATSVTPWLMRTGGHVHARFTGDAPVDHAWFSAGASLPGVSLPVDRAARRIVDGVLAGRPTVGTSPYVALARRVHGVAPATTVRAIGLAARLLPGRAPERDWRRTDAPGPEGAAVARRHPSRVRDVVTTLGRRAARRQNELG